VAALLLDRGAKIEHHNHKLNTPLYCALINDSVDVVWVLLDRGADIEHTSYAGETALFWASSKNNVEVAKFLLDLGAKMEHTSSIGATALISAATTSLKQISTKLLSSLVNSFDDGLAFCFDDMHFRANLQRLSRMLDCQSTVESAPSIKSPSSFTYIWK
jgi:ankyrin repeat protein